MTPKGLTLGGVIERFLRLYPECDLTAARTCRIVWLVDRAFAVETGQDVPEEYFVTKTQKNKTLLVPKIHMDLYYWALLRDQQKKQSEGAAEYYSERYAWEKQAAVAAWRAAKEGGIDIESFM